MKSIDVMNLILWAKKMPVTWRAALFAAALAFPLYNCLQFYGHYLGQAWFYQDDFLFIIDHEGQLKPWQLMSAENFGRFVSRNLYWWGILDVFGREAKVFFQINLLMIFCTTGLLYRFIRPVSPWLAALTATAYFIGGGTIGNFSWVSNSQHLLAHLFVAVYLVLVSAAWRRNSVLLMLISAPVFVLALSANLLSAVALSWPVFLLTQRLQKPFKVTLLLTLMLEGGFVLVLLWVLRGAHADAYSTSLAPSVLFKNMGHYYGHAAVFMGLALILGSQGVSLLRLKRPQEAWLMCAGPLFILPFLPLVYQHYLNYAVLSHVFMLVGVAVLVLRSEGGWRRAACLMLLALTIFLVRESYRQTRHFEREPRGADERALIQTMGQMIKSTPVRAGAIICFSEAGKPLHVPGEPLPFFWWGLAFGKAFEAYIHQDVQYALMESGRRCTHQALIDKGQMRWRPSNSAADQ